MFQELFNKLGKGYEKEKDLIENKKLFEAYELLKTRKEKESKLLVALIYMILQNYTKAIEVLEDIKDEVELLPKDVLYEIIGVCYYESKNFLEASKYFVYSLEENSSNFNSKYNLANIFLIKKDDKNAHKILVELLKKEPDNNVIKKNIEILESRL